MAQTVDVTQPQARLSALAQRVILADGWKRRAIALTAGALGAFALPPFDFAPAMIAPLSASVLLIDGAAARGARFGVSSVISAAGAGWWLGFGYFLAGLWWLGAAMLVEADQFAWAIPLAVVGLPAALAVFFALGFALARLLWSPGGFRVFALARRPRGLGMAARPYSRPGSPGTTSAWRSRRPDRLARPPLSSVSMA